MFLLYSKQVGRAGRVAGMCFVMMGGASSAVGGTIDCHISDVW